MNSLRCVVFTSFALTFMSIVVTAGAETGAWTPTSTIEIPHSTGTFDFLRIDSKRHRLLAAHETDGTSDFFDLEKHSLIARLKVGGAVDTAIDTESKFYYVSVQEAERVAVIDAETLKEIKSIKVKGPTDAIIFEPKNRMVYVTHDNGADVWVIDTRTNAVAATIAIPGVPEFIVYDDKTDRIYLNIKTKDVVAVIDPSTNTVVAQWPTAPAAQPHGRAADPANHRIFTAGSNGKLVMIDTGTGLVTGSVSVVNNVDQIAFDPVGELIYCAGADKMSVSTATGANLTAIVEVPTAANAKNVAVDGLGVQSMSKVPFSDRRRKADLAI